MTKNPHTPEFIKEMKERLEAEKTHLEAEIAQSKDFPDYGRSDEDNATEIADFAASASTADTLNKRLKSVLEALERAEKGTYGLTDKGEVIPENRLRANPAATTLVK